MKIELTKSELKVIVSSLKFMDTMMGVYGIQTNPKLKSKLESYLDKS